MKNSTSPSGPRSHRIHAQRFGSPSAPLVIGLHGLTGNMKNFDFIGERLGGDALQLVALDLRGRGNRETTSPGTYGWENHALDLFAVADSLGCEGFSIVGQSMGGSVVRATRELLPGTGYVVPADDRDRFLREVTGSSLVEVDANHLTVNTHPKAATAMSNFFANVLER